MIRFARRLGWSGPEVARRLGEVLKSTDRELAQEAITLLEAAGAGASPAEDEISVALRGTDPELRYLAARCFSSLVTKTPAAIKALQSVADDSNEMVRKVARSALAKSKPSPAP